MASLLLHGLLVVALWSFTPKPAPLPPPPRSIDVEVLSEARFNALTQPDPAMTSETLAAPAPTAAAEALGTPLPHDAAAEPLVNDGVIRATQLFASAILADPANRQVRDALPTLAPYDRITQLCNIEALEQIRLAIEPVMPDSVAASAYADTSLQDHTLTATGAAYRADRKWSHVAFTCGLAPDLVQIVAFELEFGPPIPEAEWDSHDLIAEDADE